MLNRGQDARPHSPITPFRQRKGRTTNQRTPYLGIVNDLRPIPPMSMGDPTRKKSVLAVSLCARIHVYFDTTLRKITAWTIYGDYCRVAPLPNHRTTSYTSASVQRSEGGLARIGGHRLTWNPSCNVRIERRSHLLAWAKKF